jgi:hypothetical protein
VKLGTLLLRNAAIGLSQLESALRNQVLYGGRLGTNLVELGFIDLELLSTYLAEMSGFPVATPSVLDDAEPALIAKLSADDAHRLRAIPLRMVGASTDTIGVAFVDPTDRAAIDEVAQKLRLKVSPSVVPELRALYYLEKLYGLPRRARFIRTGTPNAENVGGTEINPAAPDERRRAQPAGGMVIPPSFTLQPRSRRASAAPPIAPPLRPSASGMTTLPPMISWAAARERIETASRRDQIADAFVDYAKGRCDSLVLFLVRDGNALGWRCQVAPPAMPRQAIEELSLPLGGASALQAAHDAGQPYIGPATSTARPVETALWNAIGALPEPTTIVVVPILVKQRVVNLVYLHTLAAPPTPALIDELCDLATRAATSYLRLIRQARGV